LFARARSPLLALLLVACGAVVGVACGGEAEQNPIERQIAEADPGEFPLGFPLLATKNTTRVSGADPVEKTAAVARAVYPGFTRTQRPPAVTLVDDDDWRGAISGAALTARPVRAPMLLLDGDDVPKATAATLERLRPRGSPLAGRAQAFRIGEGSVPDGLSAVRVRARDPYERAAAVDGLNFRLTGQRSSNVVIASGTDPRYAMPAAARS